EGGRRTKLRQRRFLTAYRPAAYRLPAPTLSGILGGGGRRGEPVGVLGAVEGAVSGVLLLDRAPPGLVPAVPGDRLGEAPLEGSRGAKSQPGELPRVERVAPVVARAVFDEADESLGALELRQDAPRDLDVLGLVAAADVVGLPRLPFLQQEV